MQLVLSIFPGIGLLDMAFELEGFCVVRGPDVLWGGDIRRFHPPSGKFDGVIGGPPCQAFSEASEAAKGSSCPNLIPEFERCVAEVEPTWFVMENVRRAPLPVVSGYAVASYLVNNRWFGEVQLRRRRFSFGFRGKRVPLLIQPAVFLARTIKRCVLATDGKRGGKGSSWNSRANTMSAERLSIEDCCELQGIDRDFANGLPFTKEAKYRAVNNGVPLPMGRAIARAVKEAIGQGA